MGDAEAVVGWHVYLVLCADGRLYCGATVNLTRRLRQHNGELAGGARYTERRRPVVLVYSEFIGDKILALKREWKIKHLPVKEKRQLVAAHKETSERLHPED